MPLKVANFNVFCPYCKSDNFVNATTVDEGLNIITCDHSDGGCNKPFVLRVSLMVKKEVLAITGDQHQFDVTELGTIFELARRVFSDKNVRENYLDEMDLMDEEADSLKEMLEDWLDMGEEVK